MKDIEKRMLPGQLCEMRVSADNESAPPQIVGYGAVFNSRSQVMYDSFVEEIAPGAFDGVMTDDVRALFNHDANFILGRTRSGTLKLELDAKGLAYTITPPDTQTVRDMVLAPLSRGDVSGSSFAFRVGRDGDDWRKEGELVIRTIHKFERLLDVSPVTYPAYDDSQAAQRSMMAWKECIEGGGHLKAVGERRARERFLELVNLRIS